MKVYFFSTFFGYNLYFFSRFFVLFWGDEPVATLLLHHTADLTESIPDLATQTIKKIALKSFSKLPQNAPRLQERGGNFQKVPGGDPPDPPPPQPPFVMNGR